MNAWKIEREHALEHWEGIEVSASIELARKKEFSPHQFEVIAEAAHRAGWSLFELVQMAQEVRVG